LNLDSINLKMRDRHLQQDRSGIMANHLSNLTQTPGPGAKHLHFRGDRIFFQLNVDPPEKGRAFVRTNLGHADTLREEIIGLVERDEPRLGREWYDIAMTETAPGRFQAGIGLGQVGHFEAKCLFIPGGQRAPLWPDGPNTVINVEPAHTCCGNTIYNAFVRQFGPNKDCCVARAPSASQTIEELDRDGYTVIPPSGTFRDLNAQLDFIMGRLGCRYLQLLPIHPTPTTYGRMGRFGSPYAALSFTEVDPALAVFDPKATPLEQFLELVDAVHARYGKILIDIAINHTGWAARLHATHPQWLARNDAGEIQNPGAWGVVWEDLTHLDYRHKGLWQYMAQVLLTWCSRGVDGFRCDAGYMIPADAWQYMIAKVRRQYPDTLFFLEGLGGRISVTRDLLNRSNFNWAYSELFQNYDRSQIEHYLPGAIDMSQAEGLAVHFAETHDNNRLAQTSEAYARMRTALCALLSPNGAFAFANGVEWLATQKITVHDACSLNWGAERNQVADIARLTHLLRFHPCFGSGVDLSLISRGEGNFIVLLRRRRVDGMGVLVVANLDWQQPVTAGWDPKGTTWPPEKSKNLLDGRSLKIQTATDRHFLALSPGQVLCLTHAEDTSTAPNAPTGMLPRAVVQQELQAKAQEVLIHYDDKWGGQDPVQAAEDLASDPGAFCSRCNPHTREPRVIVWEHPRDLRRRVMVPPEHFLLVRAAHHFQVRVMERDRVMAVETSLKDRQGRPFALLKPMTAGHGHRLRKIELSHYTPDGTEHDAGRLLYLCNGRQVRVKRSYARSQCFDPSLLALGTNGRGAMMRVHADWSRLESRYDALLAANLNPNCPEDRRIMLTRCRGWVVYQGHSQTIQVDCLERFDFDYQNGAGWNYQIPTGQGEHVRLRITARMLATPANAIQLHVRRMNSIPRQSELDDAEPIGLILRPDIEDRNFHHTTKAYLGAEHQWPAAVAPTPKGFSFTPSAAHSLLARMEPGRFTPQPEWLYMVHRPKEARRGLEADSDLFSPGYFSCRLHGGEAACLTVQAATGHHQTAPITAPADDREAPADEEIALEEALTAALDQYVVQRGNFRTVIAGYPWFLDWGRDTLIVARGLVAAGRYETVEAILLQFAAFEDRGTLPNMIRGEDARNRDTSDAPLWLFIVSADLSAATGSTQFLQSDCNGRSLKRVLIDLAEAIMAGTPNGVMMDVESGLVYSPAHFTWMDTNHPAGTPRCGYPIEIQALWYAALNFLVSIDTARKVTWARLAEQVRAGIQRFFWRPSLGYLADCRHGESGTGAQAAAADDALRPNQLLAVTMGAVTDKAVCRSVLDACQSLLVPGAIRSLADRPVQTPIAIHHNGSLLNDPHAPYWGSYQGDEDTQRKPAYHNGTAWTWPFPSFCEAWVATYGPGSITTARAWLSSAIDMINTDCVGHLPEIVEGDAPHARVGCDAQAWGVSELLRVWHKLNGLENQAQNKQ
jgi:predicted glycogen debranching enzyme